MSERDPFDLLMALSPVATLSVELPTDDDLLASILASADAALPPINRPRRRTRRRWIVAGVGTAALATAAFAVVHRRSPDVPTQISCYGEASASPSEQVGLPAFADPVAACAELWRNGTLGTDGAPPLSACVTEGGIIAVVPGDPEVCADLGMAQWVGDFDDEEERVIALQDALITVSSTRCIPHDEAAAVLDDLLDAYGLDGWTVVDQGRFSAERPCAVLAMDPATEQVLYFGGPIDMVETDG